MKSVKVSNLSLSASDMDIGELLAYSGHNRHIELKRENDSTRVAYVTFKELQEAERASLLTDAKLADLHVIITLIQDIKEKYCAEIDGNISPVDVHKSVTSLDVSVENEIREKGAALWDLFKREDTQKLDIFSVLQLNRRAIDLEPLQQFLKKMLYYKPWRLQLHNHSQIVFLYGLTLNNSKMWFSDTGVLHGKLEEVLSWQGHMDHTMSFCFTKEDTV